ncbi:hypothetical protein Afe04nite_17790 [Asanoa ferruginea]|uniref:GNAT family N-acetyltransferase n=1 Tax=Asanoa ferruginea TaxID=53367 RepID=UPI000E25728D|nr:hypothetical protein Afe04nite_17790 [Asanoa ferruginea]
MRGTHTAVRDLETDALIGNCGMFVGRTSPAEPEIGYMIRCSSRSRGFGSEAAQLVLDECRPAGIGRVRASIRPNNTPSRRIYVIPTH